MSVVRRLGLYWSMVQYGYRHTNDTAGENWELFVSFQETLESQGRTLAGLRVLDVGCGKIAWLTLLLHAFGAEATGIDTERVVAGRGPRAYLALLRETGVERTLRTLAWNVLYGRRYYRALVSHAGCNLENDTLDARVMDAANLEFPDDSLDLVVTTDVLEHLPDVEGTVAEIARTLKPGGLFWAFVPNYTSLSGGHQIAWKYPDTKPPEEVAPWDHLRQQRGPCAPSWLNRLRERDFRAVFERHLEIVEWRDGPNEGERFLTAEIESELADYTREELLKKNFTVLARAGSA